VNILKQLDAFFSGDTLHHHVVGASLKQYPINQVIHLGLACDTLNFDVAI
jgi:hypothetical protein